MSPWGAIVEEKPIDRGVTEMMAVFYAAGELSRRGWRVFLPVIRGNPDFDFMAEKGGDAHRVEVKGSRSGSLFIFGDKWYDAPHDLHSDLVVGVRAVEGKPVEYYVAHTSEVVADLKRGPNSEWAPWKRKGHYLDRWEKLEKGD